MCNLSVIISINKNNFDCLYSVLNQTLKNIEIICMCDNQYSILDKISKKDNRIKLISKNSYLSEMNGEYVLMIDDIIHEGTCELLYNYAKSKNLDLLYVPKYNFCTEIDFKNLDSKCLPLIFSFFYKKSFFNLNNNICSKNRDFFNKNLYCEMNFNRVNIENILNEIFLLDDKEETNFSFLILMEYLKNFPLISRQIIYNLIKNNFNHANLNDHNQLIFSLILKNKYYLDFVAEYNLEYTKYDVHEGLIFKNRNYKISIVIPIYNNETLIHRTLMSIENQSFNLEDIEVLMINDASQDSTLNVINQYADKYPNFKAIHIKKGTGSAGTPRNLGLKLSSADYVLFLDHDDFLEIDALEKLYNKIIHYNCDIVYGTYVLIDNEKPIKFTYPNEVHGFFKSLEDNSRSITTPPSIWTKLFRKDFLIENNILFPTILGEDAIFMAKSLKHANGIYYLWDEIICYYNLNECSYTSNLSYDYFVEGFISEEYLFNLFNDWNHNEYYNLRGYGILNYYINRFRLSKLDDDEIRKLMPLFKGFCQRFNQLNIKPNKSNNVVFNHVLRNDVDNIIKFKNYKPNKIKVISNKLLNKINKHSFW